MYQNQDPRDLNLLKGVVDPRIINKINTRRLRIGQGAIGGPRPACLDCCRKHIAQSIILLSEAKQGYPQHRWLAVGHLAEAADETIAEYPALAAELRTLRLTVMMDKDYEPDLMPFFDEIDKLEEDEKTPEKASK
jgi:hypothetical protein